VFFGEMLSIVLLRECNLKKLGHPKFLKDIYLYYNLIKLLFYFWQQLAGKAGLGYRNILAK
jgi:hypothetical protein